MRLAIAAIAAGLLIGSSACSGLVAKPVTAAADRVISGQTSVPGAGARDVGLIQLAQRGKCKGYGKVHKCKAYRDQRDKSCKCRPK